VNSDYDYDNDDQNLIKTTIYKVPFSSIMIDAIYITLVLYFSVVKEQQRNKRRTTEGDKEREERGENETVCRQQIISF
jgi:hypothetical protein